MDERVQGTGVRSGRAESGSAGGARSALCLALLLVLGCPGPGPEPEPPEALEGMGVLAISTPAPDALLRGRVTVSGTLQPAAEGDVVELQVDGGPFLRASGAAQWSLELDVSGLAGGKHTLRARARRPATGLQTQVETTWRSDNGSVRIGLDPVQGSLQPAIAFGLHIAGTGGGRVGTIALSEGVGTVSVDGRELRALMYEPITWESFDLKLYQTLLVAPDGLHVLWAYCRGGRLTNLYLSGTDTEELTYEQAVGSCEERAQTAGPVQLPATDFVAPLGSAPFTIDGPTLQFSGRSPGTVVLSGSTLPFYVFTTVDCSRDCGAPGWYELHVLIWDAVSRKLELGILYLMQDGGPVSLQYRLAVNALTRTPGESFDAAWKPLPSTVASGPMPRAAAALPRPGVPGALLRTPLSALASP